MSAEFSATELVDIAREIERCGEAFYSRATMRLRKPRVRELFEQLRQEEVAHAREFELLLGRLDLGPAAWRQDDEYVTYMRALVDRRVFPGVDAVARAVEGLKDERDAVELALRFEADTIVFLQGLGRVVRPEDRATLDAMVAEEETHVRRLTAIAEGLPPRA